MNYIIADDSSTMRTILTRCLAMLPPPLKPDKVYPAGSGTDVLATLKGLKAQNALAQLILFLDVNMPALDGMETLKLMRKDHAFDGIAVIMCTTEPDEKTIRDAFMSGANDYILKPITPQIIHDKVKKVHAKFSAPANPPTSVSGP